MAQESAALNSKEMGKVSGGDIMDYYEVNGLKLSIEVIKWLLDLKAMTLCYTVK